MGQQGIQHVQAQASRAIQEMARLFDALAPADVTQQFQYRALGHRDEDVGSTPGKGARPRPGNLGDS